MKNKNIKKSLIFITVLALMLICSLCGCSSEHQAYIETVQNGYLGGCLDVTISEMLSYSSPDGKWNAGESDENEIIVEYKEKIEGIETVIQFKFIDENNFKVSGLGFDGKNIENNNEAALVLEKYYIRYYGAKNPEVAAMEMMPNEAIENLLNGMSASLAEKARNPVEMSEYLNKRIEETKVALGNVEFDGLMYNGDGFAISYDEENQRVDTVLVDKSRFVELFGINTFMDIETAKGRIADRFEFVEERDNGDSTATLMFIRNNCEDSLSIKYNPETHLINEVCYMYNGLEGYRTNAAVDFIGMTIKEISAILGDGYMVDTYQGSYEITFDKNRSLSFYVDLYDPLTPIEDSVVTSANVINGGNITKKIMVGMSKQEIEDALNCQLQLEYDDVEKCCYYTMLNIEGHTVYIDFYDNLISMNAFVQ